MATFKPQTTGFQRSVAQVFGKPVNTDQTQSVQGDVFDVTGHITIGIIGILHYSFKGPALVGQEIAPFETATPTTTGMVDIDFPCRFTERPLFTSGFEFVENYSGTFNPLVGVVVSWRFGKRDETGLPFYDGVRITAA